MIWESYIMCYSLILRNVISTCWRVLDQSVSELSNMERLDITLTKFIKLRTLLIDSDAALLPYLIHQLGSAGAASESGLT